MSPRTMLVVEDESATRSALARMLVDTFPDGTVLEAGDLATGLKLSRSASIAFALVDLGLPDGSGVDLVRAIAKEQPSALVVVVTIFDDDDHLFPALGAGAHGYLLKEQPPSQWAHVLRQLEEGVPALSPSVARRLLARFRKPPSLGPSLEGAGKDLTARETEVLSLIARGLRVIEVAGTLKLSEHTVAGYVKDIYRKLEISSRAEAALEATRRGLA